jgi:hypothetical protein
MAQHAVVDLSSHLNANVIHGHPAEFDVNLQPVYWGSESKPIPNRKAVVRRDTGEAIAVVSDRYVLVPHTRVLDIIEGAIAPLDVGAIPRGIYVEGRGARMRALYKFPALAKPIFGTDTICPCLQVRNSYDSSARISLHIGAFRFVCTNLAVGGGGAFAGGFVSIHAGDIPIEKMADQLTAYLTRFDRIVETYRVWAMTRLEREQFEPLLRRVLHGRFDELRAEMLSAVPATVFEAYNRLTYHATHGMRSARTAFEMLERVNHGFQKTFPVIEAKAAEDTTHEAADECTAMAPVH